MSPVYTLAILYLLTRSYGEITASSESTGENDFFSGKTGVTGHTVKSRTRRVVSSAALGLRAALALLKNAWRVPEKHKYFRRKNNIEEYEKPGDYKKALDDFYNAGVSKIKYYKTPGFRNERTVGRAGNKIIVVNKSGNRAKPNIEIISDAGKKSETIQIITYVKGDLFY